MLAQVSRGWDERREHEAEAEDGGLRSGVGGGKKKADGAAKGRGFGGEAEADAGGRGEVPGEAGGSDIGNRQGL